MLRYRDEGSFLSPSPLGVESGFSDSPMVRLSFVDFLGEPHLLLFSETILLCLLN